MSFGWNVAAALDRADRAELPEPLALPAAPFARRDVVLLRPFCALLLMLGFPVMPPPLPAAPPRRSNEDML